MSIAGSVYRPTRHAIMTEFDSEAVLFHAATGAYYGLDEVGTEVWRMLERRESAEEIVRGLLERYDARESRLRSDVERLLADLHKADLIEAT